MAQFRKQFWIAGKHRCEMRLQWARSGRKMTLPVLALRNGPCQWWAKKNVWICQVSFMWLHRCLVQKSGLLKWCGKAVGIKSFPYCRSLTPSQVSYRKSYKDMHENGRLPGLYVSSVLRVVTSRALCLARYAKGLFHSFSWMALLGKHT